MEKDRALQEVRERGVEILTMIADTAKSKVNKQTSYVCPICGHGTHGDGLTVNPHSKSGHSLKCFGCGFSGDIIDLIGKMNGKDFNAALEEAAGYLGITIDKPDYTQNFSKPAHTAPTAPAQSPTTAQPQKPQQEPEPDFTGYLLQAQKWNNGEYLKSRGISKAVQDRFGVGYVADWKHPNAPAKVKGAPYVLFPTSAHSYCARYTGTDEAMSKYKKMHVGKNAPFFCEKAALEGSAPVFVVEGETDALSLWELDYPALSLGSVSNAERFVRLAEAHSDKHYIIALDNDGAGAGAVKKITAALTEKGIGHTVVDINGDYKDPNDRLQNDSSGLLKSLKLAMLQATDPEGYKREKLKANNVSAQLADFWEQIYYTKNFKAISTGFPLFDAALDGGLFPEQLVFLGAISSLGKTTFLLQVCDNIAAAGTPVLFFSLEMSRNEIMSKSISRYTFTTALKDGIKTNNAKTMRGISAGYRHKSYSKTELDLISKASQLYGEEAGKNLYIYEGNGDTGVEEIQKTVKEFIKLTGKRPLVFIDYLQILAPHDPKMTDKQNTDYAVKVLKQLARDESIAVLAISSLNRENYFARISMQAFKESGAIEYSSDVLLGMQLKGMGTADFDVNEAKRKDPREVELHFLKNRNGVMSKPILYYYYPAFNYYRESEYIDPPVKEEKPKKGRKNADTVEVIRVGGSEPDRI